MKFTVGLAVAAAATDLLPVFVSAQTKQIKIPWDDSAFSMGAESDVLLARTGDGALLIQAETTIDGSLSVGESITVDGDSSVGGALGVKKDVSVEGDFSVGGSAYVVDFVVGGDAEVDGALTVSGSLDIAKDVAVTGALSVGGSLLVPDAEVDGALTVGSLDIAKDVSVTGDLSVGGDATVVGSLGVSESITVDGDSTTLGELSVKKDAGVGGDLSVSGSAYVVDVVVGGDAEVDGTLTVSGETVLGTDTTINGHLEISGTVSTAQGRITRDFHTFYTTTSGSYYYDMKTSIKVQGAIMYRLEILGYAYGAANNIDSVTTGYTYSGWDCVSNENNQDFDYGTIGVYCSSDGYVVLEYYCPSTYYLGLTVSGWFLNPTGNAHDIEITDTAFSASQGSFSGRRRLGEGNITEAYAAQEFEARPILPPATRKPTLSRKALQNKVTEQGAQLADLQQEMAELREMVAAQKRN